MEPLERTIFNTGQKSVVSFWSCILIGQQGRCSYPSSVLYQSCSARCIINSTLEWLIVQERTAANKSRETRKSLRRRKEKIWPPAPHSRRRTSAYRPYSPAPTVELLRPTIRKSTIMSTPLDIFVPTRSWPIANDVPFSHGKYEPHAADRKLSAEIKIRHFSVRPGIYETVGPAPTHQPTKFEVHSCFRSKFIHPASVPCINAVSLIFISMDIHSLVTVSVTDACDECIIMRDATKFGRIW